MKNIFEYLRNCSKRNFGKKVGSVYLAVVILFEILTLLLLEIVLSLLVEVDVDNDIDMWGCSKNWILILLICGTMIAYVTDQIS